MAKILLLLLSLLGAACTNAPQADDSKVILASFRQDNALDFDTYAFERRSANCQLPEGPCARVVAEYPVADRGPRKQVDFVNDSISQYVRLTLSVFATKRQAILPDLDSLAGEFIEGYERFREMNPENPPVPWVLETKSRILYQNRRVLSVEFNNFSFTGGAHPNSFQILLLLDVRDRKMLTLSDIVTDMERFEEVVKEAFRAHYQLEEAASFNEAGFFWDEPFSLPENVALTPEGLKLVYNPYEIAPYVVGATRLHIPYAELEDLLKEEYR